MSEGVVDRLNATVKVHELFRPFAPVVPEEHPAVYITLGPAAPFISLASQTQPRPASRSLPSGRRCTTPADVTHVGGEPLVDPRLGQHHEPFLVVLRLTIAAASASAARQVRTRLPM
ncbi:carbamoyltransferase C-terminal domain-containing protein [Streptomyces sp. NPDC002156]